MKFHNIKDKTTLKAFRERRYNSHTEVGNLSRKQENNAFKILSDKHFFIELLVQRCCEQSMKTEKTFSVVPSLRSHREMSFPIL